MFSSVAVISQSLLVFFYVFDVIVVTFLFYLAWLILTLKNSHTKSQGNNVKFAFSMKLNRSTCRRILPVLPSPVGPGGRRHFRDHLLDFRCFPRCFPSSV